MTLYGGIEGGGTKFVCAIGNEHGELLETTRFPTTTPDETLRRAIEFFQPHAGALTSIGIGSFGPVDLNPQSPTFGYITTTPKPGWSWADVAGPIRKAIGVPVGFELDVNIAAMGEHRWGAAQGLETFIYLTIGTGIGGGAMVGGKMLHGAMHPEMGHVMLPRDRARDPFEGACPFHGDCLEGLASGPALEKRWGQKGDTLGEDHPAWELEAHYVALGLSSFIYSISPQRIIIGGGVMQQPQLFPMVRKKVQQILNGYLQIPAILESIDTYIVPPALGGEAGVKGALALAYQIH
ncbi:MAG TPA: ROK family protein [Anaerolineales bacterium]|nr:ROK family protein [Anaerolineales bacterium]